MSRLLAISDLHLDHSANREALHRMVARPNDWLLIAGDVGHGIDHLRVCFDWLVPRFARVVWTPGNHDLWARPGRPNETRGVSRYDQLIGIARSYGVITPEDPFPVFNGLGGPLLIAPIFALYDYSFRPPAVELEDVVKWAAVANCVCADEYLLSPDPFPSRSAWCRARCAETERKLAARPDKLPTVLVSHFPLEQSLAVLPKAPRFTPWCGTTLTKNWHRRFDARAVVYGHLHIPGTKHLDGVPFQEVSLGYPRQWGRRDVSRVPPFEVDLGSSHGGDAA